MHSRMSSILPVLQPTVHNCQVHTMANHSQGPLSGFDECTIQAYQLIQLIHPTHRSVALLYNFRTLHHHERPRAFVPSPHFINSTDSRIPTKFDASVTDRLSYHLTKTMAPLLLVT